MPLSRRTAGWRTTEETPPISPSYPQRKGQYKTIENRSPLAWICTLHKREKPHYGLPNGSHASRSASSPHLIFAVKLPAPTFAEARCSWPAAPFKTFPPLLFLDLLSFSLSVMPFSALSNLDSFLYSNRGHVLRSLSLSLALSLSLSFSECHSSWKASALHSSVSHLPPIYTKKKTHFGGRID